MISYSSGSAIHKLHYLIGNQLISRILTFLLNLLVARNIQPAVYGFATLHLHLPYLIILSLIREGLRRATLRYNSSSSNNTSTSSSDIDKSSSSIHDYDIQNIVNLSWLHVLLSIPL
jgi:hypothetical protein